MLKPVLRRSDGAAKTPPTKRSIRTACRNFFIAAGKQREHATVGLCKSQATSPGFRKTHSKELTAGAGCDGSGKSTEEGAGGRKPGAFDEQAAGFLCGSFQNEGASILLPGERGAIRLYHQQPKKRTSWRYPAPHPA